MLFILISDLSTTSNVIKRRVSDPVSYSLAHNLTFFNIQLTYEGNHLLVEFRKVSSPSLGLRSQPSDRYLQRMWVETRWTCCWWRGCSRHCYYSESSIYCSATHDSVVVSLECSRSSGMSSAARLETRK